MRINRMLLALAALSPISALKAACYRLLGAKVEKDVYFAPGVIIRCPDMRSVKFGTSSSFGLYTKLICGSILVGKRVRVGGDCNIRGEASLRGDGRIIIGDDVFIGVGCILDCTGELLIEEGAQIGPGARILTHGPSLQFLLRVFDTSRNLSCQKPYVAQSTRIRSRAYIGAGAIVLPGVTIGSEAVVGAGALVTKDVQSKEFVLGVPARVFTRQDRESRPLDSGVAAAHAGGGASHPIIGT
jgi:acetyltransferase-like isoleucine patch superfamily enzyme